VISRTMRVYIGAAIDNASTDPFQRMTDILVETFPACIVYNPRAAFTVSPGAVASPSGADCAFLRATNMTALTSSDMALFEIGSSFSYGVVQELSYCIDRGIPFVVYFSNDKKPGFMMHFDLHRTKAPYEVCQSSSWSDISKALLRVSDVYTQEYDSKPG
jgi:hypothetical protein